MLRPLRCGLHRPAGACIFYRDLRPEPVAPEPLREVVQTVGLGVEIDRALTFHREDIVQELALRRQQRGIDGAPAAHPFHVVRQEPLQKAVDVLARKRQNAPVGQGDAGGDHGRLCRLSRPGAQGMRGHGPTGSTPPGRLACPFPRRGGAARGRAVHGAAVRPRHRDAEPGAAGDGRRPRPRLPGRDQGRAAAGFGLQAADDLLSDGRAGPGGHGGRGLYRRQALPGPTPPPTPPTA